MLLTGFAYNSKFNARNTDVLCMDRMPSPGWYFFGSGGADLSVIFVLYVLQRRVALFIYYFWFNFKFNSIGLQRRSIVLCHHTFGTIQSKNAYDISTDSTVESLLTMTHNLTYHQAVCSIHAKKLKRFGCFCFCYYNLFIWKKKISRFICDLISYR